MFFHLKKIQKLFSLLFLFLIIFSAFGTGANKVSYFDEDEEEIACPDLPAAFVEYEQNGQLYNHSLRTTLLAIKGTLQRFSDEKKVTQTDLLKMIEDIEEIRTLISDNQDSLIDQSDIFLFSLSDCIEEEKI